MPVRDTLVLAHLENISRAALERFQHIVRQYVGRRSGIYALYRRRCLYYVGLASNLRSRLNSHLRDRHGQSWDRFAIYLTSNDRHMKELESLVLRIVRPAGNRVTGRLSRSENLLRRLSRDMKQAALREVAEVLGRWHPRIRIPHGRKNGRPDLVGVFQRATTLERVYKGVRLRARVRKDGLIRYKRRTYLSVSQAASVAAKRPCNGWWFWQVRNPAGRLVSLRKFTTGRK